MKADLKKYKDHTILFNAREIEPGLYQPITTIFKNGEDAIKLKSQKKYTVRDEALSYALGVGEIAVDEKIKSNRPDVTLLTGQFKIDPKAFK